MAKTSPTLSSGAFDQIAADERTSGLNLEVKGVSGSQLDSQTAVIVAQMLTAGQATPGAVNDISGDGTADAITLFGRGSHAHRMVKAFRQVNTTMPLSVIGLTDATTGTAAHLAVTLAGTATESRPIDFYVGLDRVPVGVAVGDAAADLATALAAAINANADLMATASAAAAVVTVTCRHKGEIGNDILLSVNMLGALGGEALPAGITITGLGYLAGGAGNPDQTPAIAAIQNHDFYYKILGGWSDTATLDEWSQELESEWSSDRELFGRIAFTARRGSLSQLKTFGAARNDRFISAVGTFGTPGPIYELAARYGAMAAKSLANHPVRPLQTLILTGERAAPAASEFSKTDRKALLWSGVATIEAAPGSQVQIDRAVTLYQRDSAGDANDTWLDVTTPATVGAVVQRIKTLVFNTFLATRCILVDDDTPIGPGIPYASPKTVRATIIANYPVLEAAGLVENFDAFSKLFQVGRDPDNPTRLNFIYTPDIANPLITAAGQIKFSLQWPSDLVATATASA